LNSQDISLCCFCFEVGNVDDVDRGDIVP